jgi:hypothetical protein
MPAAQFPLSNSSDEEEGGEHAGDESPALILSFHSLNIRTQLSSIMSMVYGEFEWRFLATAFLIIAALHFQIDASLSPTHASITCCH